MLLFAGEANPEQLEASLIASTRLVNAEFAVIPGEGDVSTIARSDGVLPLLTAFLSRVESAARQPAYR